MIFVTSTSLRLDIEPIDLSLLRRFRTMAFIFGNLAKQTLANSTQAFASTFAPGKNDMQFLSSFIRDNTKRHWKPLAVVGVASALAYGAYQVRSEILKQREELEVCPTTVEVENLKESASLVEVGSSLDDGLFGELDKLADKLLEELELEECLEVDIAFTETDILIDTEQVQAIADCKNEDVKFVMQRKYNADITKKSRKRVRVDRLPHACRALVSKLRSSFPSPDGTAIQQKAMALYLAKECRKLKIRETQASVLIPRAVALASVPRDAQVDMRLITSIEPVKLKYQRMGWGGVVKQASWLSRLVAAIPSQ